MIGGGQTCCDAIQRIAEWDLWVMMTLEGYHVSSGMGALNTDISSRCGIVKVWPRGLSSCASVSGTAGIVTTWPSEDHEQRAGRRSGVDRLSPAPKIRATSSGTVKGDAMTLKVVVEGEESEPPEYRLLRGWEGNLMKCR